jgi:hypothetical protein
METGPISQQIRVKGGDMDQTRAFYYWAIINHSEFEFIGDKYRIARQQLQDFHALVTELLESRDPSLAGQELPPYPLGEIDDAYWSDLETTRDCLKETLDNVPDGGSLYYVGNTHLLQ